MVPFLLPTPGSLAWDFSLCLCLPAGVVGCEGLVNSENLNPGQVTLLPSYSFNSCATLSTHPSTPSHPLSSLFSPQRARAPVVTLMCGTGCFHFIALIATSVKLLILPRRLFACSFAQTSDSRGSPSAALDKPMTIKRLANILARCFYPGNLGLSYPGEQRA